ncbi:hypothetical protein B1A_08500, partial [mine drainage metagenome]
MFFGSDPPTDKMLESHPVIAKINDLLERVTGDRRLHPHNLRHSAATLTLFGALSPDLQLGEHPYLMPWMKAAMKHSAPIESAISGALHRRSGRGSAIATLMGHGSELTTYEHYVHCLDLLLFLDTWHGRYDQGPRHDKGRLGPLRHESAQLLVLLGYSTATRIEMKDPVALLRRIGERYPKAAVLLESTATSTPDRVPGAAAPALPTRFSLKHLCGLPGAETQEGFPRQQAELDAVAGLLQHLLPIDPAKHPLLTVCRHALGRGENARLRLGRHDFGRARAWLQTYVSSARIWNPRHCMSIGK